jgi:hypothetical protein
LDLSANRDGPRNCRPCFPLPSKRGTETPGNFLEFRKHVINKVSEAVNMLSEMVPEVRAMYNQVEVLIRLLLVCPASSAEAERSFSSLRRLKTWLRSTMTERRLNSVCVCHTHQDLLDSVDLRELIAVFCSRSDVRKKLFGRF